MKNIYILIFMLASNTAVAQNFSLYGVANPLQTNAEASFPEVTCNSYTVPYGIGYGIGLIYNSSERMKAFVELSQMARTTETARTKTSIWGQDLPDTYVSEATSYSAVFGAIYYWPVGETRFSHGISIASGVRIYNRELYKREALTDYNVFIETQKSEIFISNIAYETRFLMNKQFDIKANFGLSNTPVQAGIIYNLNK